MVDIATALERLAYAIFHGEVYKKTQMIEPLVLTVLTTPQSLTEKIGRGEMRVFYIAVEVRSMGTATYVRVGGANSINSSLTVQGAYQEFEAPKSAYLDASKIFIKSDTSDATVEITGVLVPEETKL